jgi:oligoendopeptidase F
VALTDLDVWHWMYAHPDASAAELREATLQIARGYWDRYYVPVLGKPGNPQLAIYSHMINSFLYLYRYPIGHLIAFQLEGKLKGAQFGAAFEHAASYGRVVPDLWMEHATGKPVVAEPMLEAAEAALEAMK